MEEKKIEEIVDSGDTVKISEEPEKSGAAEGSETSRPKKRERNENMTVGLYAGVGVYLLYTVYQLVRGLIQGEVASGRDTIFNIVFIVIFSVASVCILRMALKIRKAIKAKEKAEAEAEMLARGETPEEPARTGATGNIVGKPELNQSSVASRAAVYYNPADDEEEDSEEEKPETKDDDVEDCGGEKEN